MTDDIEAAIHRWHASDSDQDVHTWLGLTWAQYAAWMERCEVPDGYVLPERARGRA